MEPTARNSDCQFWRVRAQKSECARYEVHGIGSRSCLRRVSLYDAQPAID